MSFITRIDTSTLSNQNISSALLAHTFTNTVRVRKVFITVSLDQVAGNGDYVAYATRQHGGAGSAYELQARTTATVASGVTAIEFQTIALMAEVGDVVKIYVTGLAGDTTTPDIITEVFEELATTLAAGSISWPVTVKDGGGLPLDGVDVWVTTDVGGTNIVARGTTNALGIVTFMLDAGLYYFWKQLAGINFTNPQSDTVA